MKTSSLFLLLIVSLIFTACDCFYSDKCDKCPENDFVHQYTGIWKVEKYTVDGNDSIGLFKSTSTDSFSIFLYNYCPIRAYQDRPRDIQKLEFENKLKMPNLVSSFSSSVLLTPTSIDFQYGSINSNFELGKGKLWLVVELVKRVKIDLISHKNNKEYKCTLIKIDY